MSGGVPLDEWNGSKATKELHATIVQIHNLNSKSSNKMLFLTWAILALTVAIFS